MSFIFRFIGELFKLRILSVKIMHQCILRLLSQPEDEESLECLCRLLSTIGKELEFPQPVAGRNASISVCRAVLIPSKEIPIEFPLFCLNSPIERP